MYPEICKIGPLTVFSYGLMLAVAFVVSAYLAACQAKRQGIDQDKIFNLLFLSVISGIFGARIFYVIENITYYLKNPIEMIMLQKGGLSWFGGLIMGLVVGLIYIRFSRLKILQTLDLVAPFIALAQAIGRIGCLLNGCCYGRPSEFGIYFKVHEAILTPIQAYSSLALLLIFLVLRVWQNKAPRPGQVFFMYLLLYSFARFLLEYWRADNPVIILGLTLFQILSIAIFFISLAALLLIKKIRG